MASAPGPKNMIKDKHFVDHHRTALIDRVTQVEPILDRLLERGIITTNTYSEVRAGKKKQKRMRELFNGPVKACGPEGKDIFLDILMDLEPWLISDLKGE
ncbi:apoptosis-associated speck-like protein containing a CARD [Coregonus clupeaformis]|uniref:apoptosis-associated speck-like protein containing a CARD n=1 Tax=Coregonus clupeaformis TaxID=59861 RepID=UPI001E1C76D0|nr:apoptosis-associated speck-like protein containing a CARD [Coregonus clupeaformis]